MTTASDPRDAGTWQAWLVHHHVAIGATSIAASIVSYITDAWAIDGLGAIGYLLFLIGVACTIRHTGLLCGHCLERIPTDAAVQAKRRDWALRMFHWVQVRYKAVVVALLAVLVAAMAVRSVLDMEPARLVFPLVLWPAMVTEAWVLRFHDRVAPWCPYCRGGGGGMGVGSPSPVPTGSKTS